MTNTIIELSLVDTKGFIETLEKMSKKYKFDYSLVWGETYSYDIHLDNTTKITIDRFPVSLTISAEGYQVEGYKYLGCVKDNNMDGMFIIHGNNTISDDRIVSFVEGIKDIPCYKCNRRHSRKIGHIFLKEDTDEIVVFGSSCATNFFGVNFTNLLSIFERINLDVDNNNESYINDMRTNHVDFSYISSIVYDTITREGYTSSSKSMESGKSSTSYDVIDTLVHVDKAKMVVLNKIKEDIDFDILTNKEYTLTGDFSFNIKTIQKKIQYNCLSTKDIGFLSWMIFDEFFKVKKEKDTTVYTIGDYVVGDKVKTLTVNLLSVHTFEGSFGVTNIYSFVKDNIRFKWFTGKNLMLEIGSELVISSGSVKSLEDNTYGKSVILTRCRVK